MKRSFRLKKLAAVFLSFVMVLCWPVVAFAEDTEPLPDEAGAAEASGVSTLAVTASIGAYLSSDQATISMSAGSVTDASSVSYVRFAVWGAAGGQNDLRWYTAAKSGASYVYSAPVSNHKETGVYYIHAYARLTNGQDVFIGGASVTVESLFAGVGATNVNNAAGTFTLEAGGFIPPAAVSSVRVAVWSADGGQDDLRWYNMPGGVDHYAVSTGISAHGYGYGLYYAHFYAKQVNGIEEFIGGTTITFSPNAASVASALSSDKKQITMSANGVSLLPGVSYVQFAVWGAANGQNDLRWYTASKSGANYSASALVSTHKEAGLYYMHTYAYLTNGKAVFVGASSVTVPPLTGNVALYSQDNSAGTFVIYASAVSPAADLSSVRMAVWSNANGQDDLVWYPMNYQGGSYRATASIAKQKYEYGTYTVHVYATQKNGAENYLGAATVTLTPPPASVTATLTYDEEEIRVVANHVFVSDINYVQFAVWGEEDGQDDLLWYSSGGVGGTYTWDVGVWRHREAGRYFIHAYAVMSNGQKIFVGGTTVNVTKPQPGGTVTLTHLGDGTYQVNVSGVSNSPSGTRYIHVAVWSASGGQDDLVWYKKSTATQNATLTFSTKRHRFENGLYYVHVYQETYNGVTAFATASSGNLYCPPKPTGEQLVQAALRYNGNTNMMCEDLVSQSLVDIGIPAVPGVTVIRRYDLSVSPWAYCEFTEYMVPVGDVQRGDVLLSPERRHVEIYLGNGYSIHGGYGALNVVIAPSSKVFTAYRF
ncbi:MAG: GBS Bsp-like repeat-containing protein [Clostridiales Family XIII bacterium]|nr:GBS Bsp-like repeat-containing protein [Clostridiales Family XIII bacterium]